MTDLKLIGASLKARAGNSALSVMLAAFGVMLAVLVVLFGHHLENRLGRDGQGIDIVVGAKGSPLQLILSSVYHVDIPTGNMTWAQAEPWMHHPQVARAIPLALGDTLGPFRIVGTTHAYVDHYDGQLSSGRLWRAPFEAVLGAAVAADRGLALGDRFVGAHGLLPGGHTHDNQPYTVVGILAPTGTVLDRLALTAMDSVLLVHGQAAVEYHDYEAGHHDHGHSHHHHHHHHGHSHGGEPEITALLLTVRSPLAVMNLPRQINRETHLQAANPAYEMTRLSAMLGLGTRTLTALAAILVVIAGLSIFSGLASILQNRAGDLAVMRALGFSRGRLMRLMIGEGMAITFAGLVLGMAAGYIAFAALVQTVGMLEASRPDIWIFTPSLLWIAVAVVLAGFLASLLPAWRAGRIDLARQLSDFG